MQEKRGTTPAQAKAPQAAASGAPAKMEFPHELRKHFYDAADWTTTIFVGVSLAVNVLTIGIIAAREWRDPMADLTRDQLLAAQSLVTKAYEVKPQDEVPPELQDLPDISDEAFEQAFQQQQQAIERELQSAEQTLRELESLSQGDAATGASDIADALGGELSDIMADLDLGALDAADLGGPALDIAPTDVAFFAEGTGAGSRVVSGAIDIQSLGSGAQISSSFTQGGLSSSEARRLSQQIQFARERLGGNVKLRVASGLGEGRRAALRVASGGRTGQRIQIEQLALPPQRAQGPGGRDQDAVEVQASRTRNVIGGCYTIGLAADPNLSGLVVVRFTIQPNGSVTNVAVSKSNLGNREVEECVAAVVRTWKFEAGGGTETFEYPFTFEPG